MLTFHSIVKFEGHNGSVALHRETKEYRTREQYCVSNTGEIIYCSTSILLNKRKTINSKVHVMHA